MKKHIGFFAVLLVVHLVGLSLITGCKHTDDPLGHNGPFDVPTATVTATPTTVPGQVSVYAVVNYNATQVPGVNWSLVDPNGNTVGSATTNASNAVISTNTNVFGTYTVNLPAQGAFGFSTTTVNVPGPGTYPASRIWV